MNSDTALVYWYFCLFPVVMLAGILVPLVPRSGVRFWTSPTRDQFLVLGMFAFSVGMAVFAIRKPEFAVFMALCGTAVLLQSWGPKVWRRNRVAGAFLFPLKVYRWTDEDGNVMISLSMGARILVKNEPRNRAFLGELSAHLPEGETTGVRPDRGPGR